MNKKPAFIITAIVIYFVATGASYFLFSSPSIASPTTSGTPTTGSTSNDYEALTFGDKASKTEECPLNGALYSKDQKKWWEQHRPLGVMIENHEDARPQSGISFADVTYEAVAEGGITRTL